MTDWSPEKEDEENPMKAIREMTEALTQIEREKAARQEEMHTAPGKLHPGHHVYCLAYDVAWRETIRLHVRDAGTFQHINNALAMEIHRVALLAAENFVPPELEDKETEQ